MPITSVHSKDIYSTLWSDKNTYGSILLALVVDELGTESFDLDPQALRMDINQVFGVEASDLAMDKVNSLILALTTDLVHTDVSSFINAANALSGTPLNPLVFDPAEPLECAWAITELSLIDPDSADRWGVDVLKYIEESCRYFGIYRFPKVIKDILGSVRDAAPALEATSTDPTQLQVMVEDQNDLSESIQKEVEKHTKQLIAMMDVLPLQTSDNEAWKDFYSRVMSTK